MKNQITFEEFYEEFSKLTPERKKLVYKAFELLSENDPEFIKEFEEALNLGADAATKVINKYSKNNSEKGQLWQQ